MKLTARQISEILSGTVEGNPDRIVTTLARIENGKAAAVCFYANPKYEKYVYSHPAGILITGRDFTPAQPLPDTTLVRVDDPYTAVATLLDHVSAQKRKCRWHRPFTARIHLSSRIGRRVWIGEFTCIGRRVRIGSCTKIYDQVYIGDGTVIGENCIIYPGVKIYPGMVIGNNVILHSGVVIGSDGFGFAPQEDGTYRKIEHTGNVIIEDDVEIGANSTVDKSQIGSTIIHRGVKIDNLVQIAHNVELGENTVCCAQVGIAGSTKIGKNCTLAGQAGISGHLNIPDNTKVGPQAGVIGAPKKEGSSVWGTPSIDYNEYLRSYVVFRKNGREGLK